VLDCPATVRNGALAEYDVEVAHRHYGVPVSRFCRPLALVATHGLAVAPPPPAVTLAGMAA
jgi:hypothetical protein